MGFRFRKSVGLGKGARVNFSKSGVGFSVGTKGARITQKARGGLRSTFSIPGTGISYSSSSKHGCIWWLFIGWWWWMFVLAFWIAFGIPILIIKLITSTSSRSNQAEQENKCTNEDKTSYSYNNVRSSYKMDKDELSIARKIQNKFRIKLFLQSMASISFFASLIALIYTPYSLLVSIPVLLLLIAGYISSTTNRLSVPRIDGSSQRAYYDILGSIKSDSVWIMNEYYDNIVERNYANTNRTLCSVKMKSKLFPFPKNSKFPTISYNDKLIILHTKYLIILQGRKCIAARYDKMNIANMECRFIELNNIPQDSIVLGQRYLHQNKDGARDRRYNDNPVLTILKYRILNISSSNGLNLTFMLSK